ncbi:cation:proton antiporter subunit C [Enteractinococcus fodinae]|uniref:Multicomponent Na+:H+ antiporter subunit C n=1 Tax=Enteractinococcus fodinae TaxID=684663 RepID=A0ABU2B1C6_9MICC|nr:cation:proton antiporter subunit C [Enteractinococcus fodinae]MDR7347086.1 multicomponent Na+:H+ antiporter subunit C [Enteractinococcus fodinae]
MSLALTVAILAAGAVYLFTKREMLRVILGFVLLGHAGNLILFAAGGTERRNAPFPSTSDAAAMADPLPQAFVLTAIVIAFSITIFMLVLSVTGEKSDETATSVEELDVAAESLSDGVRHDSDQPTRQEKS